MKFNIKQIIGITVLLFSQGMMAQFYIGVQSGIGNIQSDILETNEHNLPGGALKVGYIYPFAKHFGIGTGVEYSLYKQEVSLTQPSTTLTNYEVDVSGSAFVYNVTTGNYHEKQTLQSLQIPLFVQFKTNVNKGIDFNFRLGAKYFLPVSYKIKASADQVTGTSYYPDFNLSITDLPEYGFGGKSNYSASGEYETKGIFMSTFELGFTFAMGKKNALYAAMFFENGYGSIINQNRNSSYVGYTPTSTIDRKANGLYSTDTNAEIKPVAFGLTVAWNFK